MAVDTPQKRRSMLGFGMDWAGEDLPVADGSNMDTVDQRASMLGLYSGLALDEPSTPHVVFITNAFIETVTLAAYEEMVPIDFAALYFEASGLSVTYQLLGELPNGLQFSSAGVLTGTPLSTQWYGGFYVRATDENDATAESNVFLMFLDPSGLEATGGNPDGFAFAFGFGF